MTNNQIPAKFILIPHYEHRVTDGEWGIMAAHKCLGIDIFWGRHCFHFGLGRFFGKNQVSLQTLRRVLANIYKPL